MFIPDWEGGMEHWVEWGEEILLRVSGQWGCWWVRA